MDKTYSFGSLEDALLYIQEQDEVIRRLTNEVRRKDADYEQDIALLQQQTKFQENSIEGHSIKERALNRKLKDLQIEYTTRAQSTSANFEMKISLLSTKLEEKLNESAELETKLDERERIAEDLKSQLEQLLDQHLAKTSELKQQIEKLAAENNTLLRTHENQLADLQENYVTATARLRARLEETEKKLRSSEGLLRSDMTIWAKDNAILVQKIDFLEQELSDLREKREEDRSYNQKMMKTLEVFKDRSFN